MNLHDILTEVNAGWSEWEEAVNASGCRIAEPGAAGHWSVKDMIAHITWYEQEMIELIGSRVLTGSPWWEKPLDERNALIYEANKNRLLEDIWSDATKTHMRLVQLLPMLNDEAMTNIHVFKNMPEEWVPWEIIAGNTFWHYREHAGDIRKWLAQ
jgi:hypothetical protein